MTLHIPFSRSLKERRQVVRSLLGRAQTRFNVGVADLGPEGAHQRVHVAFACVGSSRNEIQERIQRLSSSLENDIENEGCELLSVDREVFKYGDLSYREA